MGERAEHPGSYLAYYDRNDFFVADTIPDVTQ
jgi:hypothetical protein